MHLRAFLILFFLGNAICTQSMARPIKKVTAKSAEDHELCRVHRNGSWSKASTTPMSLNRCVKTIYSGACVPKGSAIYGYWGSLSLRLVPGRVEQSLDSNTYYRLADQTEKCLFAQVIPQSTSLVPVPTKSKADTEPKVKADSAAPSPADILEAVTYSSAKYLGNKLTGTPGEETVEMPNGSGSIGYFQRSIANVSCKRMGVAEYRCRYLRSFKFQSQNALVSSYTAPDKWLEFTFKHNGTRWVSPELDALNIEDQKERLKNYEATKIKSKTCQGEYRYGLFGRETINETCW